METWYRQDYDRWPDTHGHAPVTDRDFWATFDEGGATGQGVPFEHAEWELAVHIWDTTFGGLSRQSIGDIMFLAGVGLIMPGMSYAHVPWTGAPGVAFNIFVGGGLVIVGAHLSGREFPTVDREKLARGIPQGASPMVWGIPGYLAARQLVRRVT